MYSLKGLQLKNALTHYYYELKLILRNNILTFNKVMRVLILYKFFCNLLETKRRMEIPILCLYE